MSGTSVYRISETPPPNAVAETCTTFMPFSGSASFRDFLDQLLAADVRVVGERLGGHRYGLEHAVTISGRGTVTGGRSARSERDGREARPLQTRRCRHNG